MDYELVPRLLSGRLVKISGMGACIELKGRMGMLTLPLRSLITPKPVEIGDEVEIYLSYARVIPKEEKGASRH